MRRKLTLIAATVALGALLVTGATLAWFTSTDTATNTVTVGNVDIKIDEATKDDNGHYTEGEGIVWDGNMTPGQVLSKEPRIVNIGENTAWVRASVEIQYLKDGKPFTPDLDKVEAPVINYDKEKWTVSEDGKYYYYNDPLKAGEPTNELFTTVTIPNSWSNKGDKDSAENMADVTVNVIVHADAIQYDNNNGNGVVEAFTNFKAE